MENYGYLPQDIAKMSLEQQMLPFAGSEHETYTCSNMAQARQLMAILKGVS